jgi:hypothetical protein
MKQKKIPGLWLSAMNMSGDCEKCPDGNKRGKCAAERTMPGKDLVEGYDIQECHNRIYQGLLKKHKRKEKRNG